MSNFLLEMYMVSNIEIKKKYPIIQKLTSKSLKLVPRDSRFPTTLVTTYNNIKAVRNADFESTVPILLFKLTQPLIQEGNRYEPWWPRLGEVDQPF